MSDGKIKMEEQSAEKVEIAQALPKPIKEESPINHVSGEEEPSVEKEQRHVPIIIKSEKDLDTAIQQSINVSETPCTSRDAATLRDLSPAGDASTSHAPIAVNANEEEQAEVRSANIKAEAADTEDHLPDEFFDDLLQNVEGIAQAAADSSGEVKTQPSSIRVKSESSLFQQMENIESQEDETLKKWHDKLLQQLKETEMGVEDIKKEEESQKSSKHKKKKEKSKSRESRSKKRERSPSESPPKRRRSSPSGSGSIRHKEVRKRDRSPSEGLSRNRRNSPVRSAVEKDTRKRERTLSRSPYKNHRDSAVSQKDLGPPLSYKRVKREGDVPSTSSPKSDIQSLQKLTPKEKREQALSRATAALAAFKKEARQDGTQPSTFIYTPTVRKLPSSNSFITQQIYDNRSPLHTIQNVSYKFNSTANRLNLHEWGLKCMPQAAVKVARLLGIDAYTLHRKLLVTKLPSVVKKIKSEITIDEETIDQPRSVLYTNAMTQTDSTLHNGVGRQKTCTVGVQTQRSTQSSIASQTTQFGSAHGGIPSSLASMLEHLNEYQKLALNDFAELLREPGGLAGDIYQLRQRLLDIYKTASTQPGIVQQTPQPPPHHIHHAMPDSYMQQQIPTVSTRTRPTDPRLRNENAYSNHHRPQTNRHHVIPNIPEPVPHRTHGPPPHPGHNTHSQTSYYTNR